jgi:environmental stress-induced protein Ves
MNSRIIGQHECRRMPWKNGGGETIEIAVFPPAADLDEFDCRVSMATVAADGPFSIFPEIDRTLCVLSGNGISLALHGRASLALDRHSAPFSFPADIPAVARLTDGPIADFNVMTRRTGWRHTVERHRMDAGMEIGLGPSATPTIVFCQRGVVHAHAAADIYALTLHATLLVENDARHWRLRAIEPTTIIVVQLKPV